MQTGGARHSSSSTEGPQAQTAGEADARDSSSSTEGASKGVRATDEPGRGEEPDKAATDELAREEPDKAATELAREEPDKAATEELARGEEPHKAGAHSRPFLVR